MEIVDHMRSDNEVIIFQRKKTLPGTLPESLHSKGFRNRTISSLSEMAHSYDDAASPILLVDGGPEVADASEIVQMLIADSSIHTLPLVIVARSAETFEKTLSQHFCVAVGVRIPCTTTDVIAALTYIDEHYDDFTRQGRPEPLAPEPFDEPLIRHTVEEDGDVLGQVAGVVVPGVEYQTPATAEVDKHFDQIFAKLNDFGLINKPLGGGMFARAVDESSFSDREYFTLRNERARPMTDQIAECSSRWDKAHIHRTAYLSWQLACALERGEAFVELTKESCLLYLAALLDSPKEYFRRDYYHPRYHDFREELVRRVKDIAFRVGIELEHPIAGKVIGKLSAFIGGEPASGDDEIVLAASIIQGTDLVGRACAKRGYFEPDLAYDFLRRIRRGVYSKIHPVVLSCLVKVLAEAVVTTALGLSVPRKTRDDPRLIDAANEYRDQKVEANEIRVAIESLSPGMRLSRPIQSFDGREILPQDLVLDQDLIWRIWQLSSIRPLNAPLVVAKGKEDNEQE